MKECQFCGEEIQDNAVKCKHCKQWLNKKPIEWGKYLSYGWTVLINIITLIVVIGIFDSTYSHFEKIVFSLLILIYISIVSFTSVWGYQKIQEGITSHNQFKQLRNLLTSSMEEDTDDDGLQDFLKDFERKKFKFYINAVFNFIIYIIAIINIIGAI